MDNSNKKGMYWLTGSQQFHMMKNVTESLAGRVGILDLYGMSLKEHDEREQIPFLPTKDFIARMQSSSKEHDLMDIYNIIWKGSYPELNTNEDLDWKVFYRSYLRTYIERDIRDLKIVKNEMKFLKFLRVLAGRTGQLLEYSSIANQVGVTIPTVKSWISILISSNMVFLLQPYFSNINKRIIKTPKLYFLDTGLCAYLSLWDNASLLESGAMSGSILETYVISEIIKSYAHNATETGLYYYRDRDKKEIDLVIETNGKLYPVEIKKSTHPNKMDIKKFSVIPEEKMGEGAVVCLSDRDYPITKTVNAIPLSYI